MAKSLTYLGKGVHQEGWAGVLVALGTAMSLTLAFYPGILFSDTINRWIAASWVVGNTNVPEHVKDTYISPLQSISMAPVYWTTGNIAYYTCLHAFLVIHSVYYVLSAGFQGWLKWVLVVLVAACPIVVNYAVFVSTDSLTFAFGCYVAGLLARRDVEPGTRTNWLWWLKFTVAVMFLLGLRRNSILLLGPVFLWLVFSHKTRWKIGVVSMLVASLMPFALERSAGFKPATALGVGLAWEIAGFRHYNPDVELILGSWCTDQVALSRDFSRYTIDSLMWGPNAPARADRLKEQGSEIIQEWTSMVWSHPGKYIRTKLSFWSVLAGIDAPLMNPVSGPERISFGAPFGVVYEGGSDRLGKFLLRYFEIGAEWLKYLLRPWSSLALALLLSVFVYVQGRRRQLPLWPIPVFLCLFAAVYFLSFLLHAQGAYFRYFFPSFGWSYITITWTVGVCIESWVRYRQAKGLESLENGG